MAINGIGTVLISGAGLAGLALAQGLHRAGIDVQVFERDPDVDFRSQGYRIGLQEHGRAALHTCLSPELFTLFETICSDRSGIRRTTDSQLNDLGAPQEFDGSAIDRRVLRYLLLAGLDDRIHFDKQVVGYQEDEDDVTITCADGTHFHGDVLAGADGTGSAIRRQLIPDVPIIDSGVRAALGRTILDEELVTIVPSAGTLVKADPAPLLLTAMRFRVNPAEAAQQSNLPVTLPSTPDYLRWVMIFSPSVRELLPQSDLFGEQVKEVVLDMMRGWHPALREVIQRTDQDNTSLISLRTSKIEQPWPSSRVTLVGDAAHATAPTSGNGANIALQDAALLTNMLRTVNTKGISLLPALDKYRDEMLRYSAQAVKESRSLLRPFSK